MVEVDIGTLQCLVIGNMGAGRIRSHPFSDKYESYASPCGYLDELDGTFWKRRLGW